MEVRINVSWQGDHAARAVFRRARLAFVNRACRGQFQSRPPHRLVATSRDLSRSVEPPRCRRCASRPSSARSDISRRTAFRYGDNRGALWRNSAERCGRCGGGRHDRSEPTPRRCEGVFAVGVVAPCRDMSESMVLMIARVARREVGYPQWGTPGAKLFRWPRDAYCSELVEDVDLFGIGSGS